MPAGMLTCESAEEGKSYQRETHRELRRAFGLRGEDGAVRTIHVAYSVIGVAFWGLA